MGRRTAGNAHSRSWRTDLPPLSRARSKTSDPTRGATSTLCEESLFLERVSAVPSGSGDWGHALLWWRESDGSVLVQSFGPYILVQGGLGDLCKKSDILSVRLSTCSCSSCGRKSFSAKNTASSSKAVVYVPLGLRHSHEASMKKVNFSQFFKKGLASLRCAVCQRRFRSRGLLLLNRWGWRLFLFDAGRVAPDPCEDLQQHLHLAVTTDWLCYMT